MIPKDELNSRRLRFLKGMEPNSVAILFSGEPKIMSLDEDYKFEVNRNFYYLTGIEQENSILLLVKTEGEEKAILFISSYDENKEKWYGKKLTIEEAKEISSINNVLISPSFQPRLESLIKDENYPIKNIYFDSDPELKIGPALFVDGFIKTLSLSYPSLAFKELNPIITRLRMVKSKFEVCEFVKAIETTRQGIKLVMAETRGGAKEYELVSTFLKAINDDNGYQGESFNTIMASGVNATTLHYPNPQGICKTGELLLMDLGARHNYYCADISRTIPVGGKFNEYQKMVYEIVLGANKAVAKFAKPGVTLKELNELAKEYLASECLEKGIISNKEDISKYYFHSVSHHIGLDTHDLSDRDLPLEEGNIISDEPGLYIKEKGIGIRIEDDLLITSTGAEVLSSSILKEIDEIESFYKLGKQ